MSESAVRPPEDGVWSGRVDGEAAEFARWHQVVRVHGDEQTQGASDDEAGVALVGFASDEGVRRNKGRPGAALGPSALRKALAPLALHRGLCLVDAGDVPVEDGDLEKGQRRLGEVVGRLLDAGHLVVVLGGGHETAYGSFRGRAASERLAGQRVGILNLDAHFDLREEPEATSGTPFTQIAEDERRRGADFVYAAVGICRDANTAALFRTAQELSARYLLDVDCQPSRMAQVLEFVDEIMAGVDAVHLSVDLDLLPASVAPGVSAPAGFGVPLEVVLAIAERVAASGKLALVDVVELSPPFDSDGRTARAAARLISTLVHAYR